ncbi:hypothetical protein LJR234_003428 [Mesorhizobium amorphae]|uniref:hypothetical protein n=1 Tax=Mesorhizobium amorphae TaxID=71433 RepID=UPI003ECC8773
MIEHPASISALVDHLPIITDFAADVARGGGMTVRLSTHFESFGLPSSPAWTKTGAFAPDPARLQSPQAAGSAGTVPPPVPASFSRQLAGPPGTGELAATSCIRTEDGTVILFDRLTCRAVSGQTRVAAEAALRRLNGAVSPA